MITEMISTASGFQTSVNIAYDINNAEKIRHLIPTLAAVNLFEDFLLSTDDASTNRAKILIGAYGKGKSHIVLSVLSFLCRKIEDDNAPLLAKVKESNIALYNYAQEYLSSRKRLLPVIINGSNTSLVQSFLGALYNTLKHNSLMHLMPDTHFLAAKNMISRWEAEYPDVLVRFQSIVNMPVDEFVERLSNYDVEAYSTFEQVYPSLTAGSEFNPFAGFDVVEIYEKVIDKLPDFGYSGIFVVYDEFSKYLESSITKASISDINMLQNFAEKCNRSGRKQLHLLLISHKQIENYIDVLPKQKVDGWRGVSERFSHIQMHSDFSQIYEVVSQAIIKDSKAWPAFFEQHKDYFEDAVQRYSDNRLFSDCDEIGLNAAVIGCYPLHPISTFMLPRISEKVAQNERTLFTFIAGQEPTSLSGALKHLDSAFPVVTPDILYDYFAPQMRKEVYTSEIHQLYRLTSSILMKLEPTSLHAKIIKTLSLIYCLGQFERLAPTIDTILSIYFDDYTTADDIHAAIQDLVKKQCVVYLKRSNAYLKLKESSGVDVYQEIDNVVLKRSSRITAANLLNAANLEPYAYPISYNDRKEMTRFFQFIFVEDDQIIAENVNALIERSNADGVIFGILPRTNEQIPELTEAMLNYSFGVSRGVFVVPTNINDIQIHLQNLDAVQLLREAAQGDDVLFDEYDVIYQDLSEVVHRYVAQYTHPENHAAKYFYNGKEYPLYRKAHLSHLLSDICDAVYPNTPVINNEVINKNKPTTVALNSRTKLLNGILSTALQPNLGLTGSGQEVSFMRSTLVNTGILQQDDGNVFINLNPIDDALRAVLRIIDDFFNESKNTGGISFDVLYQQLTGTQDGIGMRKGLIPLFIAVVLRQYQSHTIIRDQFSEVAITPTLLNMINDNPDRYTVKLEEWDNSKSIYIESLNQLFADYIFDADKVRPGYVYLTTAMGRWYLALPKYTKEHRQTYFGLDAAEKYASIDGGNKKFLALLKQPSIGAIDLLFSRIPKCFGMNGVSLDLVTKITAAKKYFDETKIKLEDALISDVKHILCEKAPNEATLSSLVTDWYEKIPVEVKNKLFPNGAERLFGVIQKTTNDEHLLVEGLARVLTGLRLDDWTDNCIGQFNTRLLEYKATIEGACADTEEPASIDIIERNEYSVVFIDANGKATKRSFDRVERGKRSDSLYNRINSAIREMGHSISEQEKRQVLMEILEKLC